MEDSFNGIKQIGEVSSEQEIFSLANILVAVTPAPGHINPMLTVAKHLSTNGHNVTFLSGELFREQAVSAGFKFVALTGAAHFDYRRLDEEFPERAAAQPGPDRMNADCTYHGANPIPDQHRAIQEIMAESDIDLIVSDIFFMGTFPLLLGPREARPPIMTCGVLPMILSSRDTSPFSLPDASPAGRERNKIETAQFYEIFTPTTKRFNEVLHECGAPDLPEFFLDCAVHLPDRFLMFTAEAFEFPRSDLKASVKFVGQMPPKIHGNFVEPSWWNSLDPSKPVVLVTQGTVANTDLSQVIEPAIAGLADEEVTVIVATGRPDIEAVKMPGGVRPANTKVEAFIPFDKLLPKVDIVVTNAGFGTVNLALSAGKPIVAAGDTEDKTFTSIRVAWSGAGINLETGRPTSEQIRDAVRAIRMDKKYQNNATRLQREFAKYNALEEITKTTNVLISAKGFLRNARLVSA